MRYRAAAAGVVAACLGALRALFPDASQREEMQYLLVLPVGYGHLLGALVSSRRRLSHFALQDERALFAVFVGTSVLTAFAAYAWALGVLGPVFLLPLFAVFTWHTLENDLALGRSCAAGRIGPLPRDPEHHLLAGGGAALLLLAAVTADRGRGYAESFAAGTHSLGIAGLRITCVAAGGALFLRRPRAPRGWLGAGLAVAGGVLENRWMTLADVVAAATLHHVVGWLLFSVDRVRALWREGPAEARRLAARLVWVHAVPLCACLGLYASSADALAPLRFAVAAPSIYLFWSACHVLQTTLARGIEPRTG
jgi:hypothetical protein